MALGKTKLDPKTGKMTVEKITNREAKAFIMKVNRWTEKQYQRHYDEFKHRLRAKEAYEALSGKVSKQSPQELLYKQALSKQRYGRDYKPSAEFKKIMSFASSSITKTRKQLQSAEYRKRIGTKYKRATTIAFKRLIETNDKAKEIADAIKDPIKREQALKDYAEKLHGYMNVAGKFSKGSEAVFSGEVYGSDSDVYFDYSEYLD